MDPNTLLSKLDEARVARERRQQKLYTFRADISAAAKRCNERIAEVAKRYPNVEIELGDNGGQVSGDAITVTLTMKIAGRRFTSSGGLTLASDGKGTIHWIPWHDALAQPGSQVTITTVDALRTEDDVVDEFVSIVADEATKSASTHEH